MTRRLSSNVVDDVGQTPEEWSPSEVFEFDGFRVGVVGFSNPDIPELTFPGALGPFHVEDPVAAVNAEAARLRGSGIGTVVALGHMGATSGTLTEPAGPLVDLADNVEGVDAVIGDHIDTQVISTRPNGVLVVENRSRGVRFTRLQLVVDTRTKSVVYMTANFHKPWNVGVAPDPAIQERIDELQVALAPILGTVIGDSTVFVPRADACGQSAGRTCESLVGNVVTDAMRATYGVDFAITNSGGLRADLTCPTTDNPDDFCPAYTPPPFPISRGQVLGVLPFGNVVVTLTVDGAELKAMLENGVSTMPAVSGRFPQVSGLCVTYDIAAPPGSRVTGAVRQAGDGSCKGTPVDLTATSSYTIAENDFMVSGGDGYPNFASRATTREIMDQVVADHITAAGTTTSPRRARSAPPSREGSPARPAVRRRARWSRPERRPLMPASRSLGFVVALLLALVVVAVPGTPSAADGQKAGSALNMEAVGHNDLGGRGFNGDVFVHNGVAYVGHWGFTDFATGNTRFCPEEPNSGVAVLDVSDPAHPTVVSHLQNPAGTSAEDVVAYTAASGPLRGRDIAAAGIQVCGGSRYDTSLFRGLMLWDVTDPASPQLLGSVNTGCCTRGLHEFEIEHRPDLGRTFAYVTVPASEYPDDASPSGVRDQAGRGDFRLIDITDPRVPVEVSDWGVVKDAGGPLGPGLGCDPDPTFGHGAEPSDDGTLVFVSYWDSGFVALDVSDPADPTLLGHTVYPANADGDGHSASYDDARGLLFSADEDFCKTSGPDTEKGFGYLRVYDYSDRAAPVQIGDYRTPNSIGTNDQAAGDYVIHNPLVVGTDVLLSWYSDGIRVVDASDPSQPREVAYFVPPAAHNPVKPSQRGVLTNTTQVWGVAYDADTGLIYASDMNSGLWILRRTG